MSFVRDLIWMFGTVFPNCVVAIFAKYLSCFDSQALFICFNEEVVGKDRLQSCYGASTLSIYHFYNEGKVQRTGKVRLSFFGQVAAARQALR